MEYSEDEKPSFKSYATPATEAGSIDTSPRETILANGVSFEDVVVPNENYEDDLVVAEDIIPENLPLDLPEEEFLVDENDKSVMLPYKVGEVTRDYDNSPPRVDDSSLVSNSLETEIQNDDQLMEGREELLSRDDLFLDNEDIDDLTPEKYAAIVENKFYKNSELFEKEARRYESEAPPVDEASAVTSVEETIAGDNVEAQPEVGEPVREESDQIEPVDNVLFEDIATEEIVESKPEEGGRAGNGSVEIEPGDNTVDDEATVRDNVLFQRDDKVTGVEILTLDEYIEQNDEMRERLEEAIEEFKSKGDLLNKLDDICKSKDFELFKANKEVEALQSKLNTSQQQAESELWYKTDNIEIEIPVWEYPNKQSTILYYVFGDSLCVKRFLHYGFQQLLDDSGWIYMGTQGVKWIPISPPAAVNSSRLTDDGNRRASIRNPMLAGPRGSRMSEIQYHHDVDDAVPEVTIQNALLEDEAALPLGEVDVTYGNSDNEVVPTIEEASAEYMKLREYLAGIEDDLQERENQCSYLDELCQSKDAQLKTAFEEIETLDYKLAKTVQTFQSELWYKTYKCGYRIPVRENPFRKSPISNYISGEAVCVKRSVQDGYQELTDGSGWVYMVCPGLIWVPISRPIAEPDGEDPMLLETDYEVEVLDNSKIDNPRASGKYLVAPTAGIGAKLLSPGGHGRRSSEDLTTSRLSNGGAHESEFDNVKAQ